MISAILFAIAHGNFEQGLTAIIMGCFMGWIYYRTRSVMPCFLVHAVNNTTAVVVALILAETMPETMADTSADKMGVPLTLGLPLIVVSLILIYVAARYIGKMTNDRTPIPVPVDEDMPQPMPPMEEPDATLPPEIESYN